MGVSFLPEYRSRLSRHSIQARHLQRKEYCPSLSSPPETLVFKNTSKVSFIKAKEIVVNFVTSLFKAFYFVKILADFKFFICPDGTGTVPICWLFKLVFNVTCRHFIK